jgi:hypothetical protein
MIRGRSCPLIICDACGRRINGRGNVLWQTDEAGDVVVEGPLFVHVGACDAKFEYVDGRRVSYLWNDIDSFLIQLAHNAGVDWKAATRREEELREWGLA